MKSMKVIKSHYYSARHVEVRSVMYEKPKTFNPFNWKLKEWKSFERFCGSKSKCTEKLKKVSDSQHWKLQEILTPRTIYCNHVSPFLRLIHDSRSVNCGVIYSNTICTRLWRRMEAWLWIRLELKSNEDDVDFDSEILFPRSILSVR